MASEINPSLTPTKSLVNFRFWCQKVLPLVYDDSLSYYEVLGKMVVQLNDVIDNVNADTENVLTLKDAFLALQTYVNEFFDDIDQLASYAERAETAQTAANQSAINAASSASNASASSLAAMNAKDAAVAAQQAAETGANTASTAATNANTKASEAAQSAIAAQTAQASASQSATLAATDRSAAQTAASTATTKASEASTSASNAETSANNAEESKDEAETLVNSVRESLNNIQQNTQDINDLNESFNNDTNLFAVTKSTGGYLTGTGEQTNDQFTVAQTSDYIDVSDQTDITIQTWWSENPSNQSQWQAIVFYDQEKTRISNRLVKTAASGLYQVYILAIPTNAVYARISSRIYGQWKIKVQFGTMATPWTMCPDDEKNTILGNKISDDTYIKSVNHRGWYQCPENTLIAFKNSKLQGFNYVETDIRYTSDGIPVLLHDATINRTARNADGSEISTAINIADITYEQALTYDFGIYMGEKFAGIKIPTLQEFLRLCKHLALKPYLELKQGITEQNITEILNIIKSFSLTKDVSIISTETTLLNFVKNTDGTIRIGRITNGSLETLINEIVALKTSENVVFIANTFTNNADAINICINNNIPLEFWTIDNAGTLLAVLINENTKYVSGIITGMFITSNMANYLELTSN